MVLRERPKFGDKLRMDRRGRVPFAIIGVIILVMASGAGIYLSHSALKKSNETSKSECTISLELVSTRFIIPAKSIRGWFRYSKSVFMLNGRIPFSNT